MSRLILCFCLCFFVSACWPWEKKERFHGYIEGEFVRIAPTTGGVLDALYVERGQDVAAGAPLFSLDMAPLTQRQNAAIAALEEAKSQQKRTKSLEDKNFRSPADTEHALAALATAVSALTEAKQALERAAPHAPCGAKVEETYFRPGEYVGAGQPVLALLPPQNIKVRFFVPQARVPDFAPGQRLIITCDGCKAPIPAHVVRVASSAEYTPPVIFSVESREKLVFLVEALPDTSSILRPGLPVDIGRVP